MSEQDIKTTAIAPKTLSPEQFAQGFDRLFPLMCQEWPQVTPEDLKAAEGDLDLTVELIAERSDRTKMLIRRQLAELHSLSQPPEPMWRDLRENGEANGQPPSAPSPSIDDLLDLLERRTEKLVDRVKADVLPEVKAQAKRNLGTSILTALGVGFLLGLFVAGGERDRH